MLHRSLIAFLLLPAFANSQSTVGPLADPARWELRGVRSFDPDHVLHSVLCLGELCAAARAGSPRPKFLALLEASIAAGYQHAGFADVKVEASPTSDAAHLLVQVEEGPRFLAGPVRVVGNRQLGSEVIVAALAEWKPGVPVTADAVSLSRLWPEVVSCYAEHGFFDVRGAAVLVPDGERRMAPEVRVTHEGSAATVARLVIDADGDDAAAVAAHLGFAPGTVWTSLARTDLIDRIRGLGRYLDVAVDDRTRDGAGRIDPLRVTLIRAPDVPEWDKMPWADLALLMRGVKWLRQHLDGGGAVHLRAERQGDPIPLLDGLALTAGTIGLELDRNGLALTTDLLCWQGGSLGAWTLAATPQDVRILGPDGAGAFRHQRSRTVRAWCNLLPIPKSQRGRDSSFQCLFGASVQPCDDPAMGAMLQFELDMDPAALLNQMTNAKTTSNASSLELAWSSDLAQVRVQVDRASASVAIQATIHPHQEWTLALSLPSPRPATRPAAATSRAAGRSGTELIAAAVEPVLGGLMSLLGVRDRTSHRLLLVAGQTLTRPGGVLNRPEHEVPGPAFEIPQAVAAGGATLLAARSVLRSLAATVALQGWLHALLTDVIEVALNEDQDERLAAWESLQRHLRDPRCGPLARWAFAQCLDWAGKPEMAALFAHSVSNPDDAEAAWRDLVTVLGNAELRALGAAWAADAAPEVRAMFAVEQGPKDPLTVARAGFGQLWSTVILRPLRDRLRALDR